MTTNPDLAQAREWAKRTSSNPDKFWESRNAAEVIQSLPDEWIDAGKLREVIGRWDVLLADDDHEDMHGMLDDLRALFPAPQPRTLADMTEDEREACHWMQAELDGDPEMRVVISSILPAGAHVLFKDGWPSFRPGSSITPLPDLPRMVWPDEQATEEDMSIIPPEIDTSTGHVDDVDMAPEDVPGEGPWIVDFRGDRYVGARDPYESPNCALAQPEDAPDGYYLVRWWGEEHPVPAEKVQGQWWVIGKPSMLSAKDVLIVSRLIPEGEQV